MKTFQTGNSSILGPQIAVRDDYFWLSYFIMFVSYHLKMIKSISTMQHMIFTTNSLHFHCYKDHLLHIALTSILLLPHIPTQLYYILLPNMLCRVNTQLVIPVTFLTQAMLASKGKLPFLVWVMLGIINHLILSQMLLILSSLEKQMNN